MGHQIEFNDYSSEIIEFKKEKQILKHCNYHLTADIFLVGFLSFKSPTYLLTLLHFILLITHLLNSLEKIFQVCILLKYLFLCCTVITLYQGRKVWTFDKYFYPLPAMFVIMTDWLYYRTSLFSIDNFWLFNHLIWWLKNENKFGEIVYDYGDKPIKFGDL